GARWSVRLPHPWRTHPPSRAGPRGPTWTEPGIWSRSCGRSWSACAADPEHTGGFCQVSKDGSGSGARNHDRTMAMLVTAHAASATQIHTLPIHSTNGKESARPRYMQATEYIPSGKTMLHRVGVYRSGTRRKKCRHTPTAISTGISHVANAHNTTAP